MRIDSIAAQPDRAGRYKTVFSDGSFLRLYKQTVQDFGLYSGLELSEEEMKHLSSAVAEMSAKMRAVRIISASSVSKGDLQRRLIQKGENPDCAQNAVTWLEDMELLDDRKTAEQVVSRCISKGYGVARVKQALYEKRIPKAYWDEALQEYPDQSQAIQAYIDSHLPENPDSKAVKKVMDALLRKGHSYSTVRRLLDRNDTWEDETWQK